MEKARKSKWTANIPLCVCTLLCHIQGLHETAANIANSAGSGERTALDQALLLVELLKSEYAKVLKENDNLKIKNKFNEAHVQSCATTTERTAVNLDMFQHRRRWRPLAAYNYYDDPINKGKWRRDFDDKEDFGAQPGLDEASPTTTTAASTISVAHSSVAKPTAETTTKTTTNATTKTTTEKSSVSISSITEKKDKTVSTPSTTTIETLNNEIAPTAKSEVNSKAPLRNNTKVDLKVSITENEVHKMTSPSDTYTISNFVPIQNSSSKRVLKKLMLFSKKASKAKVISSTHVTQPELSQAAAELAKELGLAAPGRFGMAPRTLVLWRGSTKVYLAASTRYPLPLPENHAFCYTNPHSALCKTLV